MLGGYNQSLQLDIVNVSGGYSQLWEALDKKRIDIAFVSAYNFFNKLNSIELKEKKDTGNSHFGDYCLIGGKYTETGRIYHSGFLVSKNAQISNIAEFLRKLQDSSVNLYFVNEDLSGSGWQIPYCYLEKARKFSKILNTLHKESLPQIVSLVYNDTTHKNACTLSDDMWNNMKKISPKEADSLNFIEIADFGLPLDAIFVREDNWSDINSKWDNFVDFVKLRNVDIRKSRADIIVNSLRYMMDAGAKKSEFRKFADYLDKPY